MSLEVLQMHDKWCAINKPYGVSTHNNEDKSVIELMKTVTDKKPYFVHRLDKETTGVLIIAFDAETCAHLQEALKSSTKTYQAIVKGSFKDKSGSWKQKLTGKAEGRNNPQGKSAERKEAHSEYEVLKDTKYLSRLQVIIHTGRQHQIRKHCVLNKHPIIGDSRYGEKKYNSMINKKYNFNSMALHSKSLLLKFNDKEVLVESTLPNSWNETFQDLF